MPAIAPRLGSAAGALLALAACLAVLYGRDTALATTFNPVATYCVEDAETEAACDGDNAPAATADVREAFRIDAPESSFGDVIGLLAPDWTVARDADVADGVVVAQVSSHWTLSVAAGGCNTGIEPRFTLIDASTNVSDTIDYRDDPESRVNDRLLPLAQDRDSSGLPDGAEKYPQFLREIPALAGLQPQSRQFGWQDVAGGTWVYNVLIFDKGTTFPTINNGQPGTLSPEAGYPVITVFNDPAAAPSASIIGDFCTPLETETITFSHPRANPCAGNPDACPDSVAGSEKNRRGLPGMTEVYPTGLGAPTSETYRGNPPADGSYTFGTLAWSLRDADDDGIENQLDACPYDADPDFDPRESSSAGDPDGDGIPNTCDPTPNVPVPCPECVGPCPTGGIYDEDQDCYGNHLDNCPLLQNGMDKNQILIGSNNQRDSDRDGIGDVCDEEPATPDGHLHGPTVDGSGCITSLVVIGGGGTPLDTCLCLLLAASADAICVGCGGVTDCPCPPVPFAGEGASVVACPTRSPTPTPAVTPAAFPRSGGPMSGSAPSIAVSGGLALVAVALAAFAVLRRRPS